MLICILGFLPFCAFGDILTLVKVDFDLFPADPSVWWKDQSGGKSQPTFETGNKSFDTNFDQYFKRQTTYRRQINTVQSLTETETKLKMETKAVMPGRYMFSAG